MQSALDTVRPRDFSVLFAGSFGGSFDHLAVGLKLKDETNVPWTRGIGRNMALSGAFVSLRGSRHILASLPIVAEVDRTLSDWTVPAGRQPGQYYIKLWTRPKYAFMPGVMAETISSRQANRTHTMRQPWLNQSTDVLLWLCKDPKNLSTCERPDQGVSW